MNQTIQALLNNDQRKLNYKKTYKNKDIEELRKLMYLKGFAYNGIHGWFDPHGNATGIYHDGDGWFTIWEQKIN